MHTLILIINDPSLLRLHYSLSLLFRETPRLILKIHQSNQVVRFIPRIHCHAHPGQTLVPSTQRDKTGRRDRDEGRLVEEINTFRDG